MRGLISPVIELFPGERNGESGFPAALFIYACILITLNCTQPWVFVTLRFCFARVLLQCLVVSKADIAIIRSAGMSIKRSGQDMEYGVCNCKRVNKGVAMVQMKDRVLS